MANDLLVSENSSTYSFHGNPIRAIIQDGEPLFCLADVCKALDLTNTSNVVKQIKEEFSTSMLNIGVIERPDRSKISVPFITEPQLYFVMMRSRVKAAHDFRQWICNEVLPSIRKTGKYELKGREQESEIQEKKWDTDYALQRYNEAAGGTYSDMINYLMEYYHFDNMHKMMFGIIIKKVKGQQYYVDKSKAKSVEDVSAQLKQLQDRQSIYEQLRADDVKAHNALADDVEQLKRDFGIRPEFHS